MSSIRVGLVVGCLLVVGSVAVAAHEPDDVRVDSVESRAMTGAAPVEGPVIGGIDTLAAVVGAAAAIEVCLPDTARDAEPHQPADPYGPEADCFVPWVAVEIDPRVLGPSRARRADASGQGD